MVSPSIVSADIMLSRQMNAGLAYQHIKQSSFSCSLTGRFYRNSSMEAQRKQENKLIELRNYRAQLIDELKQEKNKIEEYDELIRKKRIEFRKMRNMILDGVLMLQSHVRRKIASVIVHKIKLMREHLKNSQLFVAINLQSRYRGFKDRQLKSALLEQNQRNLERQRHLSSILIQNSIRCSIARRSLSELSKEKKISDEASTIIQRLYRGRLAYLNYNRYKEDQKCLRNAAVIIQSLTRQRLARMSYDAMKAIRNKVKTPPRKPRRAVVRRDSCSRKTFVVQALPRKSNAAWNLVRASVKDSQARKTVDNGIISHRRKSSSTQTARHLSSLVSRECHNNVSEKEKEMMKRLTEASSAALARIRSEERAEAARARVVEYRQAQRRKNSNKDKKITVKYEHSKGKEGHNVQQLTTMKQRDDSVKDNLPDEIVVDTSAGLGMKNLNDDMKGCQQQLPVNTKDPSLKHNCGDLFHHALFDEASFDEDAVEDENDIL